MLEEGVSDSASFDNAIEVLLRQNYNVAAAMLRMVPPAWESDPRTCAKLRAYLEKAAREQEPWDGPAALVFSDGRMVGAKLDRNGLRPMRYMLTSDGLLVVGSEVGLADLRDKKIIERNRLGPGEILLVDALAAAIFRGNNEVSELLGPIVREPRYKSARPAGANAPSQVRIHRDAPARRHDGPARLGNRAATTRGRHGLDRRSVSASVPASRQGREGGHLEHGRRRAACISFSAKRPLWDYCKQRFAQVTNPPIDPLREVHVMSLEVYLGRKIVAGFAGSRCRTDGRLGRRIGANSLLESQRLSPRLVPRKMGPAVQSIDFTFDVAEGVTAANAALAHVRHDIADAVKKNPAVIVLRIAAANE